ncbi:MAG: helix-turn-helix domain-containing protein [Clostridia bacterium]|nr:helix-turn-helix domain-containing protein [Clostridia bacterium]
MKNGALIEPKAAAELLGISLATITRCIKRGAPVHRWGSTGRRYRIDPDEFQGWMERQGDPSAREAANTPMMGGPFLDVDELARRRRASVRAV